MSEIRTTTSVELLSPAHQEPFTCLAEVVAGGIGLAVKASRLMVSAGTAVMQNATAAQNYSMTLSAAARIVGTANSAREALTALTASGELEVSKAEAPALAARIEGIVARNDTDGLEREVRSLITSRQNRLRAAMIPMVVKACQTAGYEPERIDASRGLVVVRGKSGERGVIDIAKDKEGGVKLHFDTDGFAKDECTTKLVEPVIQNLRSQGASFGTQHQQPKPAHAYDRERVGAKAVCRTRR